MGHVAHLRGRIRELGKPHGYVFEVDPFRGGNPLPIIGMGRFEHEAVAFDQRGIAYLTEDADDPFGCIYRYIPNRPFGGRGSLHAGGGLQRSRCPASAAISRSCRTSAWC